MKQKPSADDVRILLQGLRASVPRAECWSCDCLQGLVVQLELDTGDDVAYLIDPLRAPRSHMHGCLGCVPCPPASAFAKYLAGAWNDIADQD
jgi:hypothetical protein